MRRLLDRFILGIPVLFIKQYPYAWIPLVVLWTWPLKLAWIFLLIVISGLMMLKWRSHAWVSNLRREHAIDQANCHLDSPGVQPAESARRVLILVAATGTLAWFLKGQFGLDFWQILLIIVGFTLLYQDTRFFGASTIYAITDQGIGIYFVPGHVDYRLFLGFKEIARVERREYQKDDGWDVLARNREPGAGLLLIPKNPDGFSRRIGRVFIAPADLEQFIQQLPPGYMRAD